MGKSNRIRTVLSEIDGTSENWTLPKVTIPYPWTKLKLQAAHELAQEIENISDEDRIILQQSIDELVKDTPLSPLAITRFKKIMLKVGQTTAEVFREILIDVLSEAAKKELFPS